MSYNFTFLAIGGDHREKVERWCEAAGYAVAGADHVGPTIDVSSQFIKGHTLISDGDLFDEAFVAELSATLDSRIVQVVCGGTGQVTASSATKAGNWCGRSASANPKSSKTPPADRGRGRAVV